MMRIAPEAIEQNRIIGARAFESDRCGSTTRRTVCHFTTVHSSLKSRSFHRQCLPLAQAGFAVSYVSPADVLGETAGIRFVRLGNSPSLFGRISRQIPLLRMLLREHANVYHFQDPQLLPLGMLLKLVFRKRVIYDAYEDFPSMAANKRAVPRELRTLFAKCIAAAERLGTCCFDAITTADSLTMRRLARAGRCRKLVFYNFPNLDFFPAPREVRKTFDFVYRGGLSERAGTFLLLDALRLIASQRRQVRLLLIGYCDSSESERRLRKHTAQLGLAEQVEVRGRIRHEEMAAALSEARIGISPLMNIPKFRLNIPVKIFEYWACGLPVIASDLPPSGPFMRSSRAGISFSAGDASALAHAMAYLLDHPEEAAEMGKRGREIVEKRLNNRHEARKLVSLCDSLLSEPAIAAATEYKHA